MTESLLNAREEIRRLARGMGFDAVSFAAPTPPPNAERLLPWLARGGHGEMASLAKRPEARADPRSLLPHGGTIVSVGMNIAPSPGAALEVLRDPALAGVAVHGRGEDYHRVIRRRLEALSARVRALVGTDGVVEACVDTTPLMEKPLAAAAGLGWQGRNTMLISRRFGGWLLLGELLLRTVLPPDPPGGSHCGDCTRCWRACPTGALSPPGVLDVSLCLAYHTIESTGSIPIPLRRGMGNRVFGCDDCVAVCPFNRFAPTSAALTVKAWEHPTLLELAALDRAGFQARFGGTGLERLGWRRLRRNVAVALGNWGSEEARAVLRVLARGPDGWIREHAQWGLAEAERNMGKAMEGR